MLTESGYDCIKAFDDVISECLKFMGYVQNIEQELISDKESWSHRSMQSKTLEGDKVRETIERIHLEMHLFRECIDQTLPKVSMLSRQEEKQVAAQMELQDTSDLVTVGPIAVSMNLEKAVVEELPDNGTSAEENQLDEEECDAESGRYGRAFMYGIRDIEKEFKRAYTEVPMQDLKDVYQIDISTRSKFIPPWQTVREKPKSSFAFRRSQADHTVIKIAEKVRSVLDKITCLTIESHNETWDLITKFKSLHVSGPPPTFSASENQITKVVWTFFECSTKGPSCCHVYSKLCKAQVDWELYHVSESPFCKALLSVATSVVQQATNCEQKRLFDQERRNDWERKKMYSKVLLIAYLYEQKLLPSRLYRSCLDALLPAHSEPPYDDAAIDRALKCLEISGEYLFGCPDSQSDLDELLATLTRISPYCDRMTQARIEIVKEMNERVRGQLIVCHV